LTIAYTRQTLGWFMATGPLVGVWWLLLLYPAPWRGSLIALVAAIPVIALVAAGLAAATTFATTGRLVRWLPEASPGRAVAAVLAVAGPAITGGLTVLGVYLGSDSPAQPPGMVAVAASLIRIGLGLLTVRRTAARRRRATVPARSPVGIDARR
jgi:hypothetical protein